MASSSSRIIAPPPPYRAGDVNDEDLMDRLTNAATRERVISAGWTAEPSNAQQEVKRVENFMQCVLSIDHQRVIPLALSSADRTHFTKLYSALCDLREAHETVIPTPDERRQLAPYFWRCPHEPCKVLNIPTEYLVTLISPFVKYQTSKGRYKGSCFGTLHSHGLGELAAKLYIDAAAVIPNVTEGSTRQALLQAAEAFTSLYFHHIHGVEGAISRSDTDRRWIDSQTFRYEANDRGEAYEDERAECIESSQFPLSVSHWTARVQSAVSSIKERHSQVKKGERKADPLCSWREPGDPIVPGSAEIPRQRPAPYAWKWKVGTFLPNFFENRSSRLRRDTSDV